MKVLTYLSSISHVLDEAPYGMWMVIMDQTTSVIVKLTNQMT